MDWYVDVEDRLVVCVFWDVRLCDLREGSICG